MGLNPNPWAGGRPTGGQKANDLALLPRGEAWGGTGEV